MSNEDLIAADQNDTGAASTEEGEVVETPPSQSAAKTLYPEEGKSEEADGEQDPPESEPAAGAPEKYELQLPEGAVIDQEFMAEFESAARAANLSNEQAQKFAELGNKLTSQITAKQAELQAKQVEEWATESRADKEFGGDNLNENIAIAKSALDQFASPKLVELLNASGLGNHPEVIRAFYKVGKAIGSDDKVVTGKAPLPPKSRAETLYGESLRK